MSRPRRAVLKRSGTVLATLSLAGCLGGGESTDDPAGDTSAPTDTPTPTTASTDAPTATPTAEPTEPSTPTATETTTETATPPGTPPGVPTAGVRRLPAPSAVGLDHYPVTAVAPASVLSLADDLGDGATAPFEGEHPVPAIDDWASVRVLLQVARAATVTVAEFDRAAVEEAFRTHESGFSESGTRDGFTVFVAESTAAAAVGDDAVVLSGAFGEPSAVDRRTAVEAVAGARAGTGPRYVDAKDAFERLVRAVGESHVFRARTHGADAGLADATADAVGYYLGTERSTIRTPVVFESGRVDQAAVAEWAGGAAVFDGYDPTTAVDGRVVTAAATLPTGEITAFTGQFPGDGEEPAARAPETAFSFEFEETAGDRGVLTVSHDGGDAVDAAALFLRGEGFAAVDGVDQTAAGPWQGTASGDDGAVVAGDSVAVGVTSDYRLAVVYESADGDVSRALARAEGPDA